MRSARGTIISIHRTKHGWFTLEVAPGARSGWERKRERRRRLVRYALPWVICAVAVPVLFKLAVWADVAKDASAMVAGVGIGIIAAVWGLKR